MTTGKRNREKDRKEHQLAKAQRKLKRREEKVAIDRVPGEDPDIAGIVPGPQPVDDETFE